MGAHWKRTILVKLQPDTVVDAAADLIDSYLVGGKPFRFCEKPEDGWTELTNDCFEKLPGGAPRLDDKLVIVGHGSIDQVGVASHGDRMGTGMNAQKLAGRLYACGLKKIGLITFKCCDIGKGPFLLDLVKHLHEFGCQVGWVKGYTSPVHMVQKSSADVKHAKGTKGKLYAAVEREGKKAGLFSKRNFVVNHDEDRLKIVRGNVQVTMSEGRYNEANPRSLKFGGSL